MCDVCSQDNNASCIQIYMKVRYILLAFQTYNVNWGFEQALNMCHVASAEIKADIVQVIDQYNKPANTEKANIEHLKAGPCVWHIFLFWNIEYVPIWGWSGLGKSEVVLGEEIPQENLVSLDNVEWWKYKYTFLETLKRITIKKTNIVFLAQSELVNVTIIAHLCSY